MDFPVFLPLGPWRVHPHLVFESLAYVVGFRSYLAFRRPGRLTESQGQAVIVGAAAGALLGSKVLAWSVDPAAALARAGDASFWLGGKSIVGGLLGGLVGVEVAKKRVGVTASTGDDLTVPLMLGMAIGRIGCFLTGLSDNVEGLPTALPWGVDFGDGTPRHPAALYECVFLLALASGLARHVPRAEGDRFKVFLTSYLVWRIIMDFLKPYPRPYLGLGAIQVAALLGLLYYAKDIRRWLSCPRPETTPSSN